MLTSCIWNSSSLNTSKCLKADFVNYHQELLPLSCIDGRVGNLVCGGVRQNPALSPSFCPSAAFYQDDTQLGFLKVAYNIKQASNPQIRAD